MDIPITITRKKIKNMYLRVHPDGTVSVSAPKRASDKVIWDFINSKSDWITAQREKILKRQAAGQAVAKEAQFLTGEIHFLWGQPCRLFVEETMGRSSAGFVENPETIVLHAPKNSTIEQRKRLLEEFTVGS